MKRRALFRAGLGSVAGAATLGLAGSAAAAGTATSVPLSSFAGATDDDRLAAAMSYCAAQTYRGTTICLDELRTYSFSVKRTLYSGFSLAGANRPQDQARSSLPVGSEVSLSTPGGLFALPGSSVFGVSFQNLSLDGSSGSRLLDGHPSSVLWTSVFRDISAQNIASVAGSTSQKLLNTACAVDGWWNVNNVRETALCLGGSDCRIAPSMFLLDSPPALMPTSGFLLTYQSQSNTHLRNLYITAEDHSAISISGGDMMTFVDCEIEGRNAGAPCKGALIRTSGVAVTIRDTWLSYAMSNPAATGRNDAGYVHATGGSVLCDGVTSERASGVSESVPVFYASGGKHRIRNWRGIGFTGLPVVKQTVPGLIDADNSVTVVTGS